MNHALALKELVVSQVGGRNDKHPHKQLVPETESDGCCNKGSGWTLGKQGGDQVNARWED